MTFSQVGNSGADTYGITVDWTFSNGLDYFVWAVTYDRGTVTFGGLWVTVLGLVSGVNVVGVNSTSSLCFIKLFSRTGFSAERQVPPVSPSPALAVPEKERKAVEASTTTIEHVRSRVRPR